MTNILIVYSSVDGHTHTISQSIAKSLVACGNRVSVVSANQLRGTVLDIYDKVIIGASVRYGKYRPELINLVKNQAAVLATKPSAFFTVNLVARKPGRDAAETNPYVRKLLRQTPWHPDEVAVFAGKLDYPRYKLLDRWVICLIMWLSGGPTAFTTVQDFTNWQKVEAFASCVASLQRTRALTP